MRVINLSGYNVDIIKEATYDATQSKWLGNESMPKLSIKSDGLAAFKSNQTEDNSITVFPIYDRVITEIDPLPEHDADDIIIVCFTYAQAYVKKFGDGAPLYTVAEPVYDENDPKKLIGFKGIMKY